MTNKKSYHVNIYLSNKDKKTLNDIKNKYHLSYSTITYIIVKNTQGWLDQLGAKNQYLYKDDKTAKTHVKLRKGYECLTAMQIDNLLKMFIRNDLKNKCNEKLFQMINNSIYNEFQNTFDDNWNGNQLSRFIPKFIKQNRNYVKKVLEDE